MQVMEKEFVRCSYAEGDRLLHELVNGSFQFGAGADAHIVTDLEQVEMFPKAVQARVQAWLERDGVSQAKKDKNAVILAEQATKSGPGVLDAMVEQLGPEAKGEIVALFRSFLQGLGKMPEKEPETVQKLQSGSLVVNEAGNREFIPDEDAMDSMIKREMEHDAKIAAGLIDAPDTAEGEDLVGVGAGVESVQEPGLMGRQIKKAMPVRRK